MVSWWGVAAAVVGAALLALALLRVLWGAGRRAATGVAGAVLLSAGLLAQLGGAIFFFAAVAAGVFFVMLVPGFRRFASGLRGSRGRAPAARFRVAGGHGSLGLLLASSPDALGGEAARAEARS